MEFQRFYIVPRKKLVAVVATYVDSVGIHLFSIASDLFCH